MFGFEVMLDVAFPFKFVVFAKVVVKNWGLVSKFMDEMSALSYDTKSGSSKFVSVVTSVSGLLSHCV